VFTLFGRLVKEGWMGKDCVSTIVRESPMEKETTVGDVTVKTKTENRFGLSKKTNVAIAGAASITVAKDSWYAIVAILVVVLVAITYQFVLDKRSD